MGDSDPTKRGIGILHRAEVGLRDLMTEAAGLGNYEAVLRLASVAKALGNLVGALSGRGASDVLRRFASAVPPDPIAADEVRRASRSAGRRRSTSKRKRRSSTQTAPAGDYPRFVRQGDELIKIGWSKRHKREYLHRAPEGVVSALGRALVNVGSSGRLITTEDLLPLRGPEDSTDFPTYQAYLALAWFVKENLVEKHGRQGYKVLDPNLLGSKVEELWGLVPTV